MIEKPGGGVLKRSHIWVGYGSETNGTDARPVVKPEKTQIVTHV